MTINPNRLVTTLEPTSPARYSEMSMGVEKKFRKLRDQTSSKNAVVTPCITREKKSHSNTAPNRVGTKLNPAALTELRYLVMKPHSTTSIATQANSGRMRTGLPRYR